MPFELLLVIQRLATLMTAEIRSCSLFLLRNVFTCNLFPLQQLIERAFIAVSRIPTKVNIIIPRECVTHWFGFMRSAVDAILVVVLRNAMARLIIT